MVRIEASGVCCEGHAMGEGAVLSQVRTFIAKANTRRFLHGSCASWAVYMSDDLSLLRRSLVNDTLLLLYPIGTGSTTFVDAIATVPHITAIWLQCRASSTMKARRIQNKLMQTHQSNGLRG